MPCKSSNILGEGFSDLRMVPRPTFLHAAEFSEVYRNAPKEIYRKFWLLELVVKGKYDIEIENTARRTCTEHMGILHSPTTRCREFASENIPPDTLTNTLYIEFDLQNAEPLQELFGRGEKALWFTDVEGTAEKLLRIVIFNVGGNLLSTPIYTLGIFCQILSLLLQAEKKGDMLILRDMEHPLPDMVMKAHAYMRAHLASHIQIAEIAEYVGMSESGFAHAYQRLTGQSPLTALRFFRIEAARIRILRGNLTLESIAGKTGFSDAFHLSRTFKKAFGLSPKQYLRSLHT